MDVKQLVGNFKTVVTKHYIDLNGRADRAAFWQYVLVYLAITLLLSLLGFRLLANLVGAGLFLPTLSISVRRLHDVGRSGWLVLVPTVPIFLMGAFWFIFWPLLTVLSLTALACIGYLIYLCAQPGMAGPNQFGPAPAMT
jgi:uncharacterized membrane protein YhaH (DUF805 family)